MKPPIKTKWYDLITIDLMASSWNTYYPHITLYNFLVIKNYSRSNPALSFKIWKLFIKFIYFEHHYDDMIQKNYTFKDINKILINYGFKKVFKSKMYFRKSFCEPMDTEMSSRRSKRGDKCCW